MVGNTKAERADELQVNEPAGGPNYLTKSYLDREKYV